MHQPLLGLQSGGLPAVAEPPALAAGQPRQARGEAAGIQRQVADGLLRALADLVRGLGDLAGGPRWLPLPSTLPVSAWALLRRFSSTSCRLLPGHAQASAHVAVEALEQHRAGLGHPLIDAGLEVVAELVEGLLDLVGLAAGLVDLQHAPLEVDAVLQRPEDLVRGAEDAVEEVELALQELEEPRVRGVLPVQEVEHEHVVLLPVAVAATDALLHPLRVPGQIVVHQQVAELEVESLCARLGGDEDLRLLLEVDHQLAPLLGRCRRHRRAARPSPSSPRPPAG